MLFNIPHISADVLKEKFIDDAGIKISVLRLDKIHPVISGNKLFKLHYYIEEAISTGKKSLVTFGGAYSNHLVAAAYACKMKGIKSIGIVRGERPLQLSHTLLECMHLQMKLHFISREAYKDKDKPLSISQLKENFKHSIIVPEGGYGIAGAKGAALIMHAVPADATHICCAVGTGTTVAGLLMGARGNQQIIAFPVLKGMNDLSASMQFLTENKLPLSQLYTAPDYHFGGYAKSNAALFHFMNTMFALHQLPLDFVYTGKMMYGVFDLIKKGFFPKGSNIVCVHTGGLQGNRSLQKTVLTF